MRYVQSKNPLAKMKLQCREGMHVPVALRCPLLSGSALPPPGTCPGQTLCQAAQSCTPLSESLYPTPAQHHLESAIPVHLTFFILISAGTMDSSYTVSTPLLYKIPQERDCSRMRLEAAGTLIS